MKRQTKPDLADNVTMGCGLILAGAILGLAGICALPSGANMNGGVALVFGAVCLIGGFLMISKEADKTIDRQRTSTNHRRAQWGAERVTEQNETVHKGNVTQAQVDILAKEVRRLETLVALTENRCRKCRIRWRMSRCRLMYLIASLTCRRVACSYMGWRPAAILIVAATFGAIMFIVFLSWLGGLSGFLVGLLVSACFLYLPSERQAIEKMRTLGHEVAALQAEEREAVDGLPGLRERLSAQSVRLQRAEQLLREAEQLLREKEYRESQQYRRQQLLKRDWKALRSVPFENFLEEVFRELGYVVETTNITGDQGADLIVLKAGHRIAIQVKGYLHSVSNSAVQEAHTAKDYYKCEACAVVTNSLFTPSAKDLADRVKCVLVDEKSLPHLIMGAIDLWQLYLSLKAQPQTGSQHGN
ncbi:MAG: restriction endonuclease [Planctomycetota bacterium]